MQPYNRSSVTVAGRSVPSNLPFFFSSSPQEVYCWVQSAQTAASLWSDSDLHRLSDSFFLYVITISAWFCPAGGSDEHTAAGHTVMQHPLLDRWWATHSWHRRKPTNQCDLGSSHPADWLWFLWKSQDVKAYWNLFFCLGDSYCFSAPSLLSMEVFTPLSSLTQAWIIWWVCKLSCFFFSLLVSFYAEKSPSEPKCFKTNHRTSTFTRLIGHMCGAGATTANIRI